MVVLAVLGFVPLTGMSSVVNGAGAIPNFADTSVLPACDGTFSNKPCYHPEASTTDAGSAILTECSVSITNFCYTATVNGSPAPSSLKIVASVGAYKTQTPTEAIAGFEAFVNAFYLPTGNTLNMDYWGSSDRPRDQSGNAGKVDLSGVTIGGVALNKDTVIKVVVKYKTAAMPHYSVLVSDDGKMDFSMSGQDMTMTLEGKPARIAIEAASQHITLDPNSTFDPATLAPNKCGLPNMLYVACNVNQAESSPLAFYARSKTFVNAPAANSPAPIWVSTNATYFHYPSVEFDSKTKTKSIRVKTGAPHFLADGTTVHTGNFSAFLPNGILSDWKIEKTDAALKAALAVKVSKENSEAAVSPTFVITDLGARVKFPEISYSAPVMSVSQVDTSTTNTPAVDATPTTSTAAPLVVTTTPVSRTVTKSIRKGKTAALASLIRPIGKGKATWKTSGACRIKGSVLVAPKKSGKCTLTLTQAKYKSTPSSKRTINITVK